MLMSAGGDAGWGRFGAGVLAPLTRYPHFVRLPHGTAGMAHPCAAPPFARVLRAILADSLCSALRIACAKAPPACSLTIVLAVKGSLLMS